MTGITEEQFDISTVSHVIHVTSDAAGGSCDICHVTIGTHDDAVLSKEKLASHGASSGGKSAKETAATAGFPGSRFFADMVNHLIGKHGFRLLHVGAEASLDYKAEICHHTVAVLGK